MRKLLYIIVATILLAACVGNGKERAALDAAQAVINDRPDSALAILDSFEPSSQDFSRKNLRRWQLLRLMAQNKCDTVFRSDSLQLVLTDYYDHHGTPNEKMLAHYLLGRAYYDMGEMPKSQREYQSALEYADTNAMDCDNHLLSIIHLQMGYMFFKQYLPLEAIAHQEKAARIAKYHQDSILYLNAEEQKALSLCELNRINEADSILLLIHNEYKKKGENVKATRALSPCILHALRANKTEKVRDYINIVENTVSCFKGDRSWDVFELYRGDYYFAINMMDSAECAYRSIMGQRNDVYYKVYAYRGLLDVYEKKNIPDSVAKYSRLYCEANDSSNLFKYQGILSKTQAAYNNDQLYFMLSDKEKESSVKSIIITMILVISILTFVILLLLYNKKKKENEDKLIKQSTDYNLLMYEYEMIKSDLALLKDENSGFRNLLQTKESQLEGLRIKMKEHDAMPIAFPENSLERSNKVKELHSLAIHGYKADNLQLNELHELMLEQHKTFINRLQDKNRALSQREIRICILIRLGFSASEISILLGISPQVLSNSKRTILKKLFEIEGKASDLNNYILSMN